MSTSSYEIEVYTIDNENNSVPAQQEIEQFCILWGHEIAIPILCTSFNEGESRRISSFAYKGTSLYNFYNALIMVDQEQSIEICALDEEQTLKNPSSVISNRSHLSSTTNASEPITGETLESYSAFRIKKPRKLMACDSMYSYLSRAISELLSEIENAAFGISVNTEDVFAAREIRNVRTIAVSIRPQKQEKNYQMCFAFPEKRWRKQRTMHCTFYKVTFAGTQSLGYATKTTLFFSF